MINVYYPESPVDLAMIKSILDEERIPYTVLNENFGDLKAGPQIHLFNERTISVPNEHAERAKEIIHDYKKTIREDEDIAPDEFTWLDKLRMLIEVVGFMWVVPGKRRKRHKKSI